VIALRVAQSIIDTLFEDQEKVPTEIRVELEIRPRVRSMKIKLDIASSEHIARKAPHSLGQIAESIAMWIDGPYNIAHRIHQIA